MGDSWKHMKLKSKKRVCTLKNSKKNETTVTESGSMTTWSWDLEKK